ncbi:hypothetical protein BDZ89DRAFT_1110941 [Hymenopellis radicata]|nr:hypothetical protein BDZ89DRAFT_1110941 [Hymenopellis radicata]
MQICLNSEVVAPVIADWNNLEQRSKVVSQFQTHTNSPQSTDSAAFRLDDPPLPIAPASRPLPPRSSSHLRSHKPTDDTLLPQVDHDAPRSSSHDLPSFPQADRLRHRFHKSTDSTPPFLAPSIPQADRRHVLPQADRICATSESASRPTTPRLRLLILDATSRPTTRYPASRLAIWTKFASTSRLDFVKHSFHDKDEDNLLPRARWTIDLTSADDRFDVHDYQDAPKFEIQVLESRQGYVLSAKKTQPDFPLEIKTLIIRELSPYASVFNPRYVFVSEDQNAAYFRDLCTVCLVWPDTIAIIRKIVFKTISIRPNRHHIDASLRNLCQALENDPNLSTFVSTLEFSDWNTNGLLPQSPHFIPTASRPLFLSFLSFIPKMHKLEHLRLDNMHFHENTSSIEFRDDLRVLKESSVKHLTLSNSTFSISAFNTFLSYWEDMDLEELFIDGISLVPHTAYMSNQMSLQIEEGTWDWDEEDTWTEWEVNKPRTASFLFITDLELTLSESLGCGILMLMDFLASHEWSPLVYVNCLQISGRGSAMTATTVIRINNLIRRYKLSFLWLNGFTNFQETIGTPLYLGGVENTEMDLSLREDFRLFGLDEYRFNWYIESLAAVPPNSRLRELTLHIDMPVPLEARDLRSQGFWGILDSALSGDNLQLDTLTVDVDVSLTRPSQNSARTPEVAQLQTWFMEICFPELTAKYFRYNKEEAKGKMKSTLTLWIGGEQYDTKKH